MSLQPYPKYKDSGVAWLGEVPEHWEVSAGRRVFEQRRDPALPQDGQLSATQKYGVIPQKLFMELEDQKVTLALSGLDNFKHVQNEDFVISLRSFQGGIERSLFSGCVSPAYTVLRGTKQGNSSFWAYLLKSRGYISALQAVTDGIRDGKNISYDQFGSVELPVPELSEQNTIATFLDRETAKIDELIAEQEKLIALLAEKRQATISHAVTKGLNPDAPMKDSGVEWLGEIPVHWMIKPLKHLIFLKSGGTPSKDNLDFWDGGVPWASAKDLKLDELHDTIDHISESAIETGAASLVPASSILVVVRGMILARTFPVVETRVPMAINQDLKAIVPVKGLLTKYLAWLLRGSAEESLRRLDEAGHGTKALRMEAWTSMLMPVPPMVEQIAISDHITAELSKLTELNVRANQLIDLLRERRTALISAAVTGKIDVRPSAQIISFPIGKRRVRGLVGVRIIEGFMGTCGRTTLQKAAYLGEIYAGISELEGRYLRESFGPLDRDMVRDMEEQANVLAGIISDQTKTGDAVIYRLSRHPGSIKAELDAVLGKERSQKFQALLNLLAPLNTHDIEGIATLYAVWNDFLIDIREGNRSTEPADDEIINGVLNDWHPKKAEEFTATELSLRLGWMRRNGLIPQGHGPKTETGRLFI